MDSQLRCKYCNEELEDGMKVCPECDKPVAANQCRKCGKELKAHWAKCPWCKEPVAKDSKCWNCGEELEDGMVICPVCDKEQGSGAGSKPSAAGNPAFFDPSYDKTIESLIKKHGTMENESSHFFAPNIPQKRVEGALGAYMSLGENEYPIFLIDSTFWESGKEGCCLTNKGIHHDTFGFCDYKNLSNLQVRDGILYTNGTPVVNKAGQITKILRKIQEFCQSKPAD